MTDSEVSLFIFSSFEDAGEVDSVKDLSSLGDFVVRDFVSDSLDVEVASDSDVFVPVSHDDIDHELQPSVDQDEASALGLLCCDAPLVSPVNNIMYLLQIK